MHLDEQELEIALMALRHFVWRAEKQIGEGAPSGCTQAALYATCYCCGKAKALIDRIEQRQKDTEEEKQDA